MRQLLAPNTDRSRRDRGSVLTMTLAMMVFGSLVLTALLTFAVTLFRNRPPLDERNAAVETARSAMRVAITLQRDHGPDWCFADSYELALNGFDVDIECNTDNSPGIQVDGTLDSSQGNYFGTGRNRYSIITTTAGDAGIVPLRGDASSPWPKTIDGAVWVAGGDYADQLDDLQLNGKVVLSNNADNGVAANRYWDADASVWRDCTDPDLEASLDFGAGATPWTVECTSDAWYDRAGDSSDGGVTYEYPKVPPIPTYQRPVVAGATIGSNCRVYYPGRYVGSLNLDGPYDYYFASGVYYFEGPVTIGEGATVVAGEGRHSGCAVDAEAAFDDEAPLNHEITGKGATFLLGDNANIDVNRGSLIMNRRVSDPNTRGSEGHAIRSVIGDDYQSAALWIPEDIVKVADDYDSANSACDATLSTTECLEYVRDHSIQVSTLNTTPITYDDSDLLTTDHAVRFSPSQSSRSEFVIDGYIYTPNAGIEFERNGNHSDYELSLSSGIVATWVDFDLGAAPANPDDWQMGVVDEAIQRRVQLTTKVTGTDDHVTTSLATVEVHADGSYAINGWTVDPGDGAFASNVPRGPRGTNGDPSGGSTGGATGGTTDGGTTDGGTTDGGTTDGGTTDGGTTDGGTTDGGATTGGGTPPPACPAADDHWSVQWFDTIDLTYPRGVQEITDFEWLLDHGGGTPPGMNVTDDDKYSARFTRTANFQAIGTYRFHFQTNDGNRFFVNGTEVHEDWEGQGWSSGYSYVDVDITDGCNVDLMMEYYQNGGTSKLQFWYEPIDVAIQGTDSGSVPAGGHTGSTHPDWVGQSGEPIGNHPENDFCTTTQTNWTSDWGGGSWLAEYWNFDDSYWTGSYGLTLYAGDPDLAEHITNSAVDWGNSGPAGQNNYFAIRWTATINVPANCTFDVRGGGDDGFALYVDGLRVSENWANHATEFDPATVTLAEGQHLLVFEMYEWGGYADAYVEWKSS